jgi:hypothetical protein
VGRRELVKVLFAVFVFASIGIAVATRHPSGPFVPAPRAIHLGEEECAGCRMIVSDARWAAELVRGPDETLVYDDPGCLLRALAKDGSGTAFFTDPETGEWIPASEVRFVTTTRTTPMGYGLSPVRASRAAPGALDLDTAIRRVTAGRS